MLEASATCLVYRHQTSFPASSLVRFFVPHLDQVVLQSVTVL